MAESCGATTRSGATCKNSPMANGRCRMHGGKSTGAPKGSANAKTHGIYQQHLTDDEREQYNALELGAVDHELRLTRVRLSRALAAEQLAAGAPELDEVTENDGGGAVVPTETRKSKVKDYSAIIDKLTARIESLERRRLEFDQIRAHTKLLEKQLEEKVGPVSIGEVTAFEVIPYDDEQDHAS